MLFRTSLFVLTGALSAAASPSMHLPARELHLSPLVVRQDNATLKDVIPAECKNECTVADEFIACTDMACVCSNDKASKYANCLGCMLTVNSTKDDPDFGQKGYDGYQIMCKEEGLGVANRTITANNNGAGRIGMSMGAAAVVALTFGAML